MLLLLEWLAVIKRIKCNWNKNKQWKIFSSADNHDKKKTKKQMCSNFDEWVPTNNDSFFLHNTTYQYSKKGNQRSSFIVEL